MRTQATAATVETPQIAVVAAREHAGAKVEWLDLYRGAAIMGVIAIHVLGRFMHELPVGSKRWYLLAVLHRGCHFAVPAFLLLSAMVNTASMRRRWGLRRYYLSRAQTILWPYVLWTGLFMLCSHTLLPGGFRWRNAPSMLLWGQGYYHLYFLWVLIQLLAVLPLLTLLVRRNRPLWPFAVSGIAATLAVYCLNRYAIHNPNFARSVFWYMPVVTLGLWLGGSLDRMPERARRAAPWAAAIGLLGFAVYCPLALRVSLGLPMSTFWYQVGEWTFSAGASVLLLWLARCWAEPGPAGRLLGLLGRWSLPIYLAHPLVFLLLDRAPRYSRALGVFPSIALYLAAAAALPMLLALAANRVHAYPLLFGRPAR